MELGDRECIVGLPAVDPPLLHADKARIPARVTRAVRFILFASLFCSGGRWQTTKIVPFARLAQWAKQGTN
jgi:hypothetical protein